MKPWCVGVIGPNKNSQDGVNSFNLYSGQVIDCYSNNYDILPMPAEAITLVHKMAQWSPIGLVFGDQTNVIDNNDDDLRTREESDNEGSSSDNDDNDKDATNITGIGSTNYQEEDNKRQRGETQQQKTKTK